MSTPRNLELVAATPVQLHTHTTGAGVTFVESLTVNNMDAAVCWVKIWAGDAPAHASDVPTWEIMIAASDSRPIPVYGDFARGCWIAVGTNPGANASAPSSGARITAITGEV